MLEEDKKKGLYGFKVERGVLKIQEPPSLKKRTDNFCITQTENFFQQKLP